MKVWHLVTHRKELNRIAMDIVFVASCKQRPTRSGRTGTFLSGRIGAYVIMGTWHVTHRSNTTSHNMSPESVMKPDKNTSGEKLVKQSV